MTSLRARTDSPRPRTSITATGSSGAGPAGRKGERGLIGAGLQHDVRPVPKEPGPVSTGPCDDLALLEPPRLGHGPIAWSMGERLRGCWLGQDRECGLGAAHSEDLLHFRRGTAAAKSRTAATAKTIETAKSGTNTIRAVRSFWMPTASGTAMSGTTIIGYRAGQAPADARPDTRHEQHVAGGYCDDGRRGPAELNDEAPQGASPSQCTGAKGIQPTFGSRMSLRANSYQKSQPVRSDLGTSKRLVRASGDRGSHTSAERARRAIRDRWRTGRGPAA